MKKNICIVIFCYFFMVICDCFASQIPGEECFCGMPSEKIYIEQDSIYMSQNQILVYIHDDLIPVSNLSSDANGLYILLDDLFLERKKETWWKCPCGTVNSMDIRWCRCGRHWSQAVATG